MAGSPRILIVAATFYQDIADEMLAGAIEALDDAGASHDVIEVPGAFEIPAAINYAHQAGKAGSITPYDGYVALGCVIRGETSHYDYVCGESARGLMTLSLDHEMALVNGILTVENREQAMARASRDQKNKGGEISVGLLEMLTIKKTFGLVQ